MKPLSFLCLLSMCLLTDPCLSEAHLLRNGTFEDGLAGWTTVGSNFSIYTYDLNQHALGISRTADGGTIYQDVPAWSNCCYTFSIDYHDTNTVIALKLDFLSAEGTPLLSLSTNYELGQSTSPTLTAFSPPDSVTIRSSLCIGPYTNTSSFSRCDDADLSYVSDTLTTMYVAVSSTNPVPPYSDWSTAATNIQNAVDVAQDGATVLVGDGIYDSGERASGDGNLAIYTGHYGDTVYTADSQQNRLVLDHPIIVQSAHGPSRTILKGCGGVRCAFLAGDTSLIGFTLRDGDANVGNTDGVYGGGGAMLSHGGRLIDCIVVSNQAAEWGGGVCCWDGGRVERTIFIGNDAYDGGGLFGISDPSGSCEIERCTFLRNTGRYSANAELDRATVRNSVFAKGQNGYGSGLTLNKPAIIEHCTIVSNVAWAVGGVLIRSDDVSIRNSVIYSNVHAVEYAGTNTYNWFISLPVTALVHCCTSPLPPGEGNIDANPLLRTDTYQPLYGSPCIDAGMDLPDVTNDLLGIARPIDGDGTGGAAPDLGAYEYDASMADSDDDGMTDDHESRAGCGPNDPTSCLRLSCLIHSFSGDPKVVRWQSVAGKRYNLLRTSDLRSGFSPVATGIDATPPENTFTDLTAPASEPSYYRIELAE